MGEVSERVGKSSYWAEPGPVFCQSVLARRRWGLQVWRALSSFRRLCKSASALFNIVILLLLFLWAGRTLSLPLSFLCFPSYVTFSHFYLSFHSVYSSLYLSLRSQWRLSLSLSLSYLAFLSSCDWREPMRLCILIESALVKKGHYWVQTCHHLVFAWQFN